MKKLFTIISSFLIFAGLKAQTKPPVRKETTPLVKPKAQTLTTNANSATLKSSTLKSANLKEAKLKSGSATLKSSDATLKNSKMSKVAYKEAYLKSASKQATLKQTPASKN